ncbi:amidohydrolase family protein [Desulfatiferula olefinivorans]
MPRSVLPAGDAPEIHRAGFLVCDADSVIENGCVRIERGRITYAGPFTQHPDGRIVDHGPGLLMPALVNAHTHLELSALKGRLSVTEGFESWVRQLLSVRDGLGLDALTQGVLSGCRELIESGTGVVGDISTLGIVAGPLTNSGLSGVLFREYLGNTVPPDDEVDAHGSFVRSLAGHAPHTGSPNLLAALKQRCRKHPRPFSIHLAESDDEMAFITRSEGPWAEFLTSRSIDFSDWGLPARSPVQHLDNLGLLDENTLCVHVLRADHRDLALLRQARSPVCLCPRSNLALHQRLPDVPAMIDQGLCLCLGTDSLASIPTLNLVDDMALLAHRFPGIAPKAIFRMATENGARALGFADRFGRLAPGYSGVLCYADPAFLSKQTLFESMYHG